MDRVVEAGAAAPHRALRAGGSLPGPEHAAFPGRLQPGGHDRGEVPLEPRSSRPLRLHQRRQSLGPHRARDPAVVVASEDGAPLSPAALQRAALGGPAAVRRRGNALRAPAFALLVVGRGDRRVRAAEEPVLAARRRDGPARVRRRAVSRLSALLDREPRGARIGRPRHVRSPGLFSLARAASPERRSHEPGALRDGHAGGRVLAVFCRLHRRDRADATE